MELLDRHFRLLFRGEADESKASWSTRFAVLGDVNVGDLANLGEELAKLLVRRGKVQVPYEYLA